MTIATGEEFCVAMMLARPGVKWSAPNDCLDVADPRLEWLEETTPPTQAELEQALEAWKTGRTLLEQRLAVDAAELAAAREDQALQDLLNMAPAQIGAAIDNAFPDPAQRVILKRVCRVLLPTARKVFRS
jgi:hypothetical protein